MKILLSPQNNTNELLKYEFEGNKVIARHFKLEFVEVGSDIFDFTDMPDGVLENVETELAVNPILNAEKKDGVLRIELLNFIGEDATEEERFPKWKEIENGED